MPLETLGATSIDTATEESRGLHKSWLAIARVVYSWTDRRESAADKAWWQNQAPRFYMHKPGVPDETRMGEGAAPDECLIHYQLLQDDLSETNEMLAGLASRSSCRGHAFLSDESLP